jgi:hypothetical protein
MNGESSKSSARPAERYEAADDLWILTSYFNPVGYRTRLLNYEMFRRSMVGSGLHLTTVECAFGDDAFQLPSSPDVIRVRARDVMWQKERLLNLAIERLPARCAKVAWLDCDLLFENPRWAVLTSELLERHRVVQPFRTPVRWMRDGSVWAGDQWALGYVAACAADPGAVRGGDRVRHGDPGMAWAARREVLKGHGLYDRSILGGADHFMAHAMFGDVESRCIDSMLGIGTPYRSDAEDWGRRFHAAVGGDVAHVPGAVFLLWHGDYEKRLYRERREELLSLGFDPSTDLRLGDSGCWEWATDRPELHRWVRDYFAHRDEDGAGGLAPGVTRQASSPSGRGQVRGSDDGLDF